MDLGNIVRSADAITEWDADRVARATSSLRVFGRTLIEAGDILKEQLEQLPQTPDQVGSWIRRYL